MRSILSAQNMAKHVRTALPVDWLKLVHKGRLKDDAIEDKEVKREGLYVAPLLTEAWLLLQGKAVFAKRRPAQERDDKLFTWSAARKLRKDFSQLSNSSNGTDHLQALLEGAEISLQDRLRLGHRFSYSYE